LHTIQKNKYDDDNVTGAPADKLDRARLFEVVGDKGLTEEFYYDGKSFGRRIYKPDGSLFSDKSVTIGVESDAESADGRPIKASIPFNYTSYTSFGRSSR
jgi:hypothetical protein